MDGSLLVPIIQECVNFLGATKLDILGWEFQMGLEEEINDIEETFGIEIRPRRIPDSTQELKSADEDIQFDTARMEHF